MDDTATIDKTNQTGEKPRKRITKACDQCNGSRSKCNGVAPCTRCRENGIECTYNRQSRRHGRVSKAIASRSAVPYRISAQPEQATQPTSTGAMQATPSTAVPITDPPGSTIPFAPNTSFDRRLSSLASTSESRWRPAPSSWLPPIDVNKPTVGQIPTKVEHASTSGTPRIPTLPPIHTPSSWTTPAPGGTNMHGSTQQWLNDAWLSSVGEPFGYLPSEAGPMFTPRATTYSRAGTTFSQAAGRHEPGLSSRSQSSTGDMNVKYPVLRPVMPYIGRIISASLACDLLDSFLANIDDGIYVPSSPLLLTHIFRKESLLSTSKPRPCTPALLASMLLISAHTTESPFFGQSPAARMQLYQQLLQLTLDLLESPREQVDAEQNRAQGLATRLYRTQPNVIIHPDAINSMAGRVAPRSRHSYLDDIVTYMHIALVTTTTQSKPAGSRWWHTAFQLAREFKLNREIRSGPSQSTSEVDTQPSEQQETGAASHSEDNASDDDEQSTDGGTSPMSVSEDAVVEPGPSKTGHASLQEREERRRIWWTLYLWDRQLALRFNSPLAIKDAESQDTQLPLPDDQWQTLVFDDNATSQNEQQQPAGSRYSRTGPPTICTGTGLFDVLLPLMCILGQIIDLHHLSYHPRVERSSSNAVADAYINTITQQLNELEPSIQNMLSRFSAVYSVLDDMTSRRMQRHRQMLHCYARFLQHLLYALVGGQWDKLTLLEHAEAFTTTPRFHMALNNSVAGADVLSELRSLDPDVGFKAMFFGIFTYHAATLPYVAVTHYKSKVNASVLAACQTYVRIFEATNCTHYSEYLRKMRKLLLFGIDEATTGIEITRSESHLRTHILKLYRWTGDGTGLGL